MNIQLLRCPGCGADLEVASAAETIRCKFCGARCRIDWRGSDGVLTEEAQDLADALRGIDLDALERELNALNEMLDADNERREALEEATDRLGTDEQLEEMASKIVAAGMADEFLAGVDNLGDHGGDPVTLMGRDLTHRLALRVRRVQAALPVAEEPARLPQQEPSTLDQLRQDLKQERLRLTDELAEAQRESAEADRDLLLALRAKYRKSRIWAILGFLPLMLLFAALGGVLIHFEWTSWLKWAGWFLLAMSPVVAIQYCRATWHEGTDAARQFNERAYLHGLPELRVKPKTKTD